MADLTKKLDATLRRVVRMLVAGEYQQLEELTHGVRLTASELRGCVEEYGRTLAPPPETAFAMVDVIKIWNASPPKYSVVFHLYTVEEGDSDLEVRATFIDDGLETMTVELDGILVA